MKPLLINTPVQRYTPVLVKWKDTASYHGWQDIPAWIKRISNPEYVFGLDCTSVGLIVHWNERGIVICLNHCDAETGKEGGLLLEIPNGVITEVYELE